jgi:NO-binding membrane sensor protein with MHYT domain
MYQVLNCLGYEHDLRLVALAGAVCLLACAVAVSLFHRARASQGRTRLKWLALAYAVSVAHVLAGTAVWGVHMGLTQGVLAALVADFERLVEEKRREREDGGG